MRKGETEAKPYNRQFLCTAIANQALLYLEKGSTLVKLQIEVLSPGVWSSMAILNNTVVLQDILAWCSPQNDSLISSRMVQVPSRQQTIFSSLGKGNMVVSRSSSLPSSSTAAAIAPDCIWPWDRLGRHQNAFPHTSNTLEAVQRAFQVSSL